MTKVVLLYMFAGIVTVGGSCFFRYTGLQGIVDSANLTGVSFIKSLVSDEMQCVWEIKFMGTRPGRIKLMFTQFRFNGMWPNCNGLTRLTIIDPRQPGVREVTYCGSKLPPVFYSDGPELRIKMTGKVSKQMRGFSERFIARYEATLTHPPHQRNCGNCGSFRDYGSGMIRSPNFGSYRYLPNCDCIWHIVAKKNYIIEFKFWTLLLEPRGNRGCHDYVRIHDGLSESSKLLGEFCGHVRPSNLKTSGNEALVKFFSDFSGEDTGFELMFKSRQSEKDLTSLRSIAAILGGVSFGIFVFLLLCSVIYKKYTSTEDHNRDTSCVEQDIQDDYVDAVQASAPPSYQRVMAEPDLFPRTPETSPNVTPNVTPSLLRRNIIRPSPLVNDITTPVTEPSENPLINQILEGIEPENLPITPPPPYPGLANHAETSRQNSVFEDYPPPGYDTCTDSDDNDEPVPGRVVHTTSITSVTSVTSDTALLSAEPGCSNTSDVGSSVRTGPCDCGGEESSTNGHGCSDDSENGSCVQSDCCGRSGAEPHILPQKTWGYESGTSHDLESNDPEQSEMLTDILSSLTPDIQRSFKRLDSSLKMKNSCRRRKNSRQDYENSRQEQANGRITESHSSSNISRTGANIAIQRQYSDGALWERYVRSPAVGRGSSALSRRKNKNGDLSSGSNKKHRHSPTQRQQVAPAIIVNSPSNTVVGPPSSISPAARSETDIFNLSRHAQYSSLPHKQFPNSSGAQRPDSNGGFNLSRQNSYTSRIETNPFELNSRSALNNPEVSVIGISDSQSLNASLNISLDDLDSSNV